MGDQAQPTPHEELSSYEIRAIVAGTRKFDDYRFFAETMDEYHARFAGKKVVYISGKAKTGADDMVIHWCKERGLPWAEFPALWKDFSHPLTRVKTQVDSWGERVYNVMAGNIRNAQMAEHGTDLITFWDGVSTGTADMAKRMLAKVGKDNVLTVLITTATTRNPS